MFPLRATRPHLLTYRFILTHASTSSYKNIFSFLFNAAYTPHWILLPQLSLLTLPLSYFTPPSASVYMQALPLSLISISQTNSSAVLLRLFNNFLPHTLSIVIDKIALFILTAGVLIAIYPFRSLTLRDLSHIHMWAFIIFKAFPPFIQVIPLPLGSYYLQLPINRICRNYHISKTACIIFF